jgi:hypothetical protein
MKILLDKYPKGTYDGQRSDGKYIDGYLYSNLKILAQTIVKDMTFMGVIYSSTLEVGTGKSVLATQIGEAWTEVMKEVHGMDIPFSCKNIVWRPKELIERSFQVPKYSYLLLDEWEDTTYWSELGMSLRTFFRKCRQLNLFIMVIIPNWFQMPMGYAISRSVFAIDVKFGENFSRGNFSLYGFEAKRNLYIKGKKEHNYRVAYPDFSGRFVDGYGVPEEDYRRAKLLDLKKYEVDEPKPLNEREIKIQTAKLIYENTDKLTQKDLAKAFGVDEKTISRWFCKEKDTMEATCLLGLPSGDNYNTNPMGKKIVWDEAQLEAEETKEMPITIVKPVQTEESIRHAEY